MITMSPGEVSAIANTNVIELIIDFGAIIIGFGAIYLLIRLNQTLGGKIKSALWFFVLGVLSNVVAILWSLFLDHMYNIGGTMFNIHQFFMTVGMIFFIISTHRFSSLIQS